MEIVLRLLITGMNSIIALSLLMPINHRIKSKFFAMGYTIFIIMPHLLSHFPPYNLLLNENCRYTKLQK